MDSRGAPRIVEADHMRPTSWRHKRPEKQQRPWVSTMTVQQAVDTEALKARIKATWAAGDYSRIASFTERAANEFIDRLQLKPKSHVLDVACGNGNLSIPAAKAGAIVTGIDIAPNLLDEARSRAARERVTVEFREGDAEALPYETGAFDLVVSMFGVMFAPRPDVAASELGRVCRPGGRIAMANWTPTGFIGELFKVTGKHVAPPAGVPSPLLWGDETAVRERLGGYATDMSIKQQLARLKFPFSISETVEFYRLHYGPTLRAFAGLSQVGQTALRRDLEDLYAQHNKAADGTTAIEAEYLELVLTRG
jgi:2-polyprenyl-3-methyl-5-hydroxy-6-metoxy-1,4-benzoquinol methylase